MALKGELLSADLCNVFQMLAMNGKRGLLTVQDRVNPVVRRRFFLDGQTVLFAEPISQRPSLPLLVEMGRITYEQYASAMTRARRFNSDPFGILQAQGTVGQADVEAFRTRAANEALLEVFLWRDIRFDLDEGVTLPPHRDSTPLQIDHVIMEAARRQDEWRHVVEAVGSHREVFRKCLDNADQSKLGPMERIVLELINGVDATPILMAKCELPRYFVDLSLANLLKAGLVARLGPEELIMTGDRLVAAGQVPEGIRMFHGALRNDRMSIAVHKRLADAHQATGEIARACGHLRFCALLMLRDGDRQECLNLLQQAWKLLPTHFSTLERILSVLLQGESTLSREDKACLADGRRLLQVWHDTGEAERAVDLATRIWAIDQSEREVLHTAARLNVRLGRIDAAIAAYLVLAERLRADHNFRGALDVYRTIASLEGGNSHDCESKMEELRRELDRIATRKQRGKSFRVAMFVSIALGVAYAGYAWFADQKVRDLEARVVDNALARDQLIKDLKVAAFWFELAPAGRRAAEKAGTLVAEDDAAREAQRIANEQAAERLAAQHRAADEAVAEGMRMVKDGDLVHAADRFREGLASYPAQSGASSRVAKALEDVETYLAAGRALLEEAKALEPSDPDAAFRLRLKALRDFELVPEIKGQKLAVRIETVPPEAKLFVHGDPQEYSAPIGISVGGQGVVAVEARAPGFVPRTVALALPPEVATWTVVLERSPRTSFKVGEPLASVAPAGTGKMLVTARNGPAFLIDLTSTSILGRFKPSALDSQSRPPVISGPRALLLLDDGRARVLDLPTFTEVKTVRLAAQRGINPVALPGGWAIASAPDRLEILGTDGRMKRSITLPKGTVIRDLAASDGKMACAAGEVGLLLIDSADGRINVVSPKLTGAVEAGPGGSWFAHRPQVGIVRVDSEGAHEAVVHAHRGDSATIRKIDGDRFIALLDGEIVFFSKDGVSSRARLPGARADGSIIVDATGGRAGVVVDGWCSVFDFVTGRCVAGFACEQGLSPGFVQGLFVNVHADGHVTITDP